MFAGRKVKQNGRKMGHPAEIMATISARQADLLYDFIRHEQKNITITIGCPEYAFLSVQWHTFCHTTYIMNIRIDFNSNGSKNVVHVSGRLAGSAVAQLKKACDSIEDLNVMDLTNLLFADDRGIDAIRALIDKGWQIRGASPFVKLLLKNAPGRKTGSEESGLT